MKCLRSPISLFIGMSLMGAASIWASSALPPEGQGISNARVTISKGEVVKADIITTGSVEIDGDLKGACAVFGSTVLVTGAVDGDMMVIGGSITVQGALAGNTVFIGAPARILGRINGPLRSFGGDVTLGPNSVVNGYLSLIGGHLIRETGSKINASSDTHDFSLVHYFLPLTPSLEKVPVLSRRVTGTHVFRIFLFWLGVGIISSAFALFLHDPVIRICEIARGQTIKAFSFGLLIFVLALPFVVVLVFTVIGIPMAMLFLCLLVSAILVSICVMAFSIADYLGTKSRKPLIRFWSGYGVLISVGLFGEFIRLAGPTGSTLGDTLVFLGMVVYICASIPGVGAVAINWLSPGLFPKENDSDAGNLGRS